MVSILKIFTAFMIIIFLDLVLQSMTGKITIQGEEYAALELVIFLFDILATFIALVIHLVTHVFIVDVVVEDFMLLFMGILSLIFWLTEGSIELVLHLIGALLTLLFSVMPASGFILDLADFGSLSIEFTSLSFFLTFPNLDIKFSADIVNITFKAKNKIGFSLIGVAEQDKFNFVKLGLSKGGELSAFDTKSETIGTGKLDAFAGLFIELDDYVKANWRIKVELPVVSDITGLKFEWEDKAAGPFGVKDIDFDGSLEGFFAIVTDAMGIEHPRDWMASVYDVIAPGLGATLALHSYYRYLKRIQEVESIV